MSNIFKGIKLNEVDPRNFDSDIDYYNALNKPRRGRSEDDYVEPQDDEPIKFKQDPSARPQYSISKDEDRQAGYNMTLTVKAPTTQKAQWAAESYVDSEWGAKKQVGKITPVSDGVVQVHMIDNHKYGMWKPWKDEEPIAKPISFNESAIIDEASKLLESLSPESRTSVLNELSNELLGRYKKAAGADASSADKKGDYERGNKRFKGIVKATKKEFDNDAKGVTEDQIDENLRKWFKEKWVRFGPDGKIRGACARGDDSEGKPKCLPQSKAHSLGKKGRASAAARKRREDPNPERSGKAINVNTKKKSNEGVAEGYPGYAEKGKELDAATKKIQANLDTRIRGKELDAATKKIQANLDKRIKKVDEQGVAEGELDEACWKGYHKEGNKKMFGKTYPNCVKNTNEEQELEEAKQCPECGGPMFSDLLLAEKKDACYHKVRSRYKVWPSAYASGALVQCRKKGASNWGNGGKSNESIEEDQLDEKWSQKYKDSINCSNPKGFSQKAHCAGKNKNESIEVKETKSNILKGLMK